MLFSRSSKFSCEESFFYLVFLFSSFVLELRNLLLYLLYCF